MKFIFPGKPIARQERKHGTRGGKSYSYGTQTQLMKDHKLLLLSMISQLSEEDKKELKIIRQCDAFEVSLTFHLPFPKSFSKRRIRGIVEGFEFNKANVKPDFDNCEKFYIDVAKEILYKDDCQVVASSSYKFFDLEPKTIFRITPLGVPSKKNIKKQK